MFVISFFRLGTIDLYITDTNFTLCCDGEKIRYSNTLVTYEEEKMTIDNGTQMTVTFNDLTTLLKSQKLDLGTFRIYNCTVPISKIQPDCLNGLVKTLESVQDLHIVKTVFSKLDANELYRIIPLFDTETLEEIDFVNCSTGCLLDDDLFRNVKTLKLLGDYGSLSIETIPYFTHFYIKVDFFTRDNAIGIRDVSYT